MSLRIKICGITNREDAFAAVDAGANALGFVFYEPSPRHVSFAAAAEIIRKLPPLVAKVGLFVNAPAEFVFQAIAQTAIDTLQFHGDEPPAFCRAFPLPTIKAMRVQGVASLQALPAYETSAWLLDGFAAGKQGGTGATFDWDLARQATQMGRPIILAGGLTPENVANAVRHVAPYAVDVSSGVESALGRKDHQKIREFVTAAMKAAAGERTKAQ